MYRDTAAFRPTAFAAALLLGALPSTGFPGLELGQNERVNQYGTSDQYASDIARDALGNFVVVWASAGQDGSGDGIFGRRYAADGRPTGDEFAINTKTQGNQQYPSVAMSASGGFVVVWVGPDADGDGIHKRLYDAQGHAQADQSRVNDVATGYQSRPDVAMDAAGNFVVIWTHPSADGEETEIFQRRFASDGTPLGDGRRANKTVAGYQDYGTVAMDSTGDYVIAWDNYTLAGEDVLYRRFDHTGTARDVEDVPVAVTSGGRELPLAAMDASGNFVIAWGDDNYGVPEPQDHAIYARRFKATGTPRDADPLTVTVTTASVFPLGLAMDATGDAVVTWRVKTTDTSSDVLFRLLGSDGVFDSGILRVNTNTTRFHEQPSVAMDADGDFVISWNAAIALSGDANVLVQRHRYSEQVNLGLFQTDTPDPVGSANEVRYTLKVANLKAPADLGLPAAVQDGMGAATGVTLVDTLPAGTTFVSAQGAGWTCRFHAPKVTCDSRRPVRAGDRMDAVNVSVMAPGTPGTLTNHAVVSADQRDARPTNNASDESTAIQ